MAANSAWRLVKRQRLANSDWRLVKRQRMEIGERLDGNEIAKVALGLIPDGG
ncbi:hypothetical protein [Fervidibacter sp.]|jgi:hypothetical protein